MNETPQNQAHPTGAPQDQSQQDQQGQDQQGQAQQGQAQQDQAQQGQAYPGQGQAGPASYRQLRRSRSDRMLAGVCGGIADYLRVDPTLVRVGFAVLTVVSAGAAAIAYLVAWLLMPEA